MISNSAKLMSVLLALLSFSVATTAETPATTPTDEMLSPSPEATAAPPATMYFVPAGPGAPAGPQVEVTRRLTFCPPRDLGTTHFTVLCMHSDTSTKAVFRVNGTKVGKALQQPYYLSGMTDGIPNAWSDYPADVKFTLVCSLGERLKSQIRRVRIACPNDMPPVRKACVTIAARSAPELSDGWVADHIDGVTYRPGNRSKELTASGVSPLFYTFKAPVTSQYGVAIDLTTRGRADFNDVHMRFSPGGFQLMRDGHAVVLDRWIKGYHSLFNRGAKIASQVDHVPYSVSTAVVLQEGEMYEFAISGRSNQVTVHSIILFGCEGNDCDRRRWKAMQEMCVPGSTAYSPRPRKNA